MTISIGALVWLLLGLLLYLFGKGEKPVEIGRLMFFAGELALLLHGLPSLHLR